ADLRARHRGDPRRDGGVPPRGARGGRRERRAGGRGGARAEDLDVLALVREAVSGDAAARVRRLRRRRVGRRRARAGVRVARRRARARVDRRLDARRHRDGRGGPGVRAARAARGARGEAHARERRAPHPPAQQLLGQARRHARPRRHRGVGHGRLRARGSPGAARRARDDRRVGGVPGALDRAGGGRVRRPGGRAPAPQHGHRLRAPRRRGAPRRRHPAADRARDDLAPLPRRRHRPLRLGAHRGDGRAGARQGRRGRDPHGRGARPRPRHRRQGRGRGAARAVPRGAPRAAARRCAAGDAPAAPRRVHAAAAPQHARRGGGRGAPRAV
ncbi:MAG: Hypothetical protein of L-Asparaginase type 2-like superfamily, partial [uncultured Gemmatimonadaceae bacterium]